MIFLKYISLSPTSFANYFFWGEGLWEIAPSPNYKLPQPPKFNETISKHLPTIL